MAQKILKCKMEIYIILDITLYLVIVIKLFVTLCIHSEATHLICLVILCDIMRLNDIKNKMKIAYNIGDMISTYECKGILNINKH